MNNQISLFPRSSDVEAENIRALETLLRARAAWLTARQISEMIWTDKWSGDDRRIRQLASKSEWIVSGQKGYKHLDHATAEEVNHFANWMESQAKEMIRRAEAVRRNAHRVFG